MLDSFIGTEATTKALEQPWIQRCLLEPRHRNFTSWDTHSECNVKLMLSFLHDFVEQVLNPESELSKSEKVLKSSKKHMSGEQGGSVTQRQSVWMVPRGLCLVVVFPEHVPVFLPEYQMDLEIFEKAMDLSCKQWSGKRIARLNSMDERALITHKSCVYGSSFKLLLIDHTPSSTGMLHEPGVYKR